MVLIRDLVQQVLVTGYLTLAEENQLRSLLKTKYEIEDLNAFMSLQEAAMNGSVKQESLMFNKKLVVCVINSGELLQILIPPSPPRIRGE
jgi:hypothetical protein